jgi:hypothetical protein
LPEKFKYMIDFGINQRSHLVRQYGSKRYDGALWAYGVERILVSQNIKYTSAFSLNQTSVLVDLPLILRVVVKGVVMFGRTSR